MSHDERIRQLTGLIIEDLRNPIEASLRDLLTQMLGLAAQEQSAAVQQALTQAAGEHRTALDAALEAAGRAQAEALDTQRGELAAAHEQALEALRVDLAAQHAQALEAQRTELLVQREQALEALRADLVASQEQALQAQRTELLAQHEQALETLRADLAAQHEQALQAQHTALLARHEQTLDALRVDFAREREDALSGAAQTATEQESRLQAAQEEFSRSQDAALAALRDELTLDKETAVRAACDQLALSHDAALATLREELANERDAALAAQRQELVAEREAAVQAAREELAREHDTVLAQWRETADRDREAAEGEREALVVDLEGAVAEARAAADAKTAEALAWAQQERDAARGTVADLTDQLAMARARYEQLTDLAHAESEATEQVTASSADAHLEERQAELACTERLVTAIRRLDEARTLSEVLTVLADHVASETLRTAVLVVHAGRLRGWRGAGIGDAELASLDLPLQRAGFLAHVVESGAALTVLPGAPENEALPPFLLPPDGRAGLALPILVGGRVVAVLYADDATADAPVVPSDWPEVAEVAARHAGRCLEALTLARANGLAPRAAEEPRATPGRSDTAGQAESDEAQEEESARRHARLLISEIKLYNEGLVERGRREGNLLALLGPEIERARRLYEEKIPAAVRQRVDCFDEEIVRTLAGGDRALLGQIT